MHACMYNSYCGIGCKIKNNVLFSFIYTYIICNHNSLFDCILSNEIKPTCKIVLP